MGKEENEVWRSATANNLSDFLNILASTVDNEVWQKQHLDTTAVFESIWSHKFNWCVNQRPGEGGKGGGGPKPTHTFIFLPICIYIFISKHN